MKRLSNSRACVLVASLVAGVHPAENNNSIPAPLSIPPSQYWDGNDGQWSTFSIQVGNPTQEVRLLPGTSASAGDSIWVVLPEGCSEANPNISYSTCANDRGNLFSRNESTTWTSNRLANNGLYSLDTYEEAYLGLNGNAYYGFDTVGLYQGSPDPIGSNQLIAGIATNDFWLGSLGLSPLPMNFTTLDEPVPSLLGNLRNSNIVPSNSWAYTAGAAYRESPVFGSLTIGGYDANRMRNKSISVPFGEDQSRDLLIGLRSITYNTFGSQPLLSEGIYVFIDSMVSQMWLPLDVCRQFEETFGLVWNETAELYILNETTHAQLRAQNPLFHFILGAENTPNTGNATHVTLPYAAFDLNVSAPYVNGSMPYFPLKRAQNSSQYTLGRVFLQEAYLIADYDRRNFTIGQAAFPSNSTQDLKAILEPGAVIPRSGGGSSLGGDAIAGIVVGVIVAVVLLVGVLIFMRRRRRLQRHDVAEMTNLDGSLMKQKVQELEVGQTNLAGSREYYKLAQPGEHTGAQEMVGSPAGTELVNSQFQRPELPTRKTDKEDASHSEPLYELEGAGVAAVELENTTQQQPDNSRKQ